MWSLGVVLYEMLCDALPWNGDSYDGFVDSVARDDVEFPGNLGDHAIQLVLKLLHRNPKRRMKMGHLLSEKWLSYVW